MNNDDLTQKLMVGFGCDTIPALPYNHNTLIWVGLSWKVMDFSMGVSSTCGKVKLRLPQAVNELPEHLCSAQDGGFVHGWEITLIGGGPYTRVCN